nr:MAG TPA: hypothetical protein [Caudoviricetes sp.]
MSERSERIKKKKTRSTLVCDDASCHREASKIRIYERDVPLDFPVSGIYR